MVATGVATVGPGARCRDCGSPLLTIELFPYEPFAPRIWELRENVTAYGWDVAIAESLGTRLATLDRRLIGAAGPRCDFAAPPD